jgi:3-hydroxyisobutyrate dehydrogenase-like beta-hydroxyacid dehydrogenase
MGLGNIGGAIASNLVADGHRVTVADRVAVRREAQVAAGAHGGANSAAVARASQITFTSLPSPQVCA